MEKMMTRIITRLKACGKIWCLVTLGAGLLCRGSEARVANATPAGAVPTNLVATATAAERAGRLSEATAAYEALLATDDRHASVLAPKLVNLYIRQHRPERALSWAHKVMAGRPDPEAYLAGVLTQLDQWKESELLLRSTLSNTSDPLRRVTLLWQLSEVQEHQGGREAALQSLSAARGEAQGTSLQAAAAARLEAVRSRPAVTNAPLPVILLREEAQP
jgi:tetratricopeptide (TPR) repeat protein